MSMISEQVKRLRKLANQWKHNDVAGCNLIFEAANTIEALSAKVRTTDRPKGEWIDHQEDGSVECPFCGHATTCEDNKDELHFCFYCGAKMGGDSDG